MSNDLCMLELNVGRVMTDTKTGLAILKLLSATQALEYDYDHKGDGFPYKYAGDNNRSNLRVVSDSDLAQLELKGDNKHTV